MARFGRKTWAGLAVALGAAALVSWWATRPATPLDRARAAYRRGDWQGAADAGREHLRAAPDDRDGLRLLARASGRLRKDEATRALYLRLGAEGGEAEDYFLLGTALARGGDPGRAMVLLERGKGLDPDHAETLDALAERYAATEFPTAAIEVARRLATLPGWAARGNERLGALLLRRHDAEGAARAFGEALRFGPDSTAVRKLLARARLEAGQPAEATQALKPAAADPETAWLIGRARLAEGKSPESTAALPPAYGEPAPFVGDARCASCHPAIHKAQSASRHAHTFARGADATDLPLPAGPLADPRVAGVSHELTREGGEIRARARVGPEVFDAVVAYVLGSGHRGRTGLVRDAAGVARESRLTDYAAPVGWGLTVHHPDRPEGPRAFLGKPMIEDQVEDCLHCHVTDVRSARDSVGPLADDRGVRCELCHGPGGNHLKAVALGLPDLAIGRFRDGPPEARNALCARCHRAPRGASPTGRDFVRFQSPTLVMSRCYTETDGALDCTACHDPHRDAEATPAFYDAVCLDCHGPARTGDAGRLPPRSRRLPCPVNGTSGCTHCHMPAVPEAVPNASYTDHFIRARRGPGL